MSVAVAAKPMVEPKPYLGSDFGGEARVSVLRSGGSDGTLERERQRRWWRYMFVCANGAGGA